MATGSLASANIGSNGVQMNGVQMNGVQMNGVQMNGVQMNGVSVQGLRLDGSALHGNIFDANSSCSHSALSSGAPLDGCSPCAKVVAASDAHCATQTWDATCVADAQRMCVVDPNLLVGATFTADTSSGPVTLRLDSVEMAPDPAPVWQKIGRIYIDTNQDVWAYHFSYYQWSPILRRGLWLELCPTAKDLDGMSNAALAVGGTWERGGKTSDQGFTLACNDVGALAKCIQRFQYKPWRTVYETSADGSFSHYQPLGPFHEACVRMVRGDYCGDGEAHTVDGTRINAWDHMGVDKHGLVPTQYQFEAGWTPHGAACISVSRYQSFGGNMSPPPGVPYQYPDAIKNCTGLAPLQWNEYGPYIIEGCGRAGEINPDANQSLPGGVSDWPRAWYDIANESQR